MAKNVLFIFTGPQGTQKNVFVNQVMEGLVRDGLTANFFQRVPIHTTETSKIGDPNFSVVEMQRFHELEEEDFFLERLITDSACHGVSTGQLKGALRGSHAVILTSIEAAHALKRRIPGALTIYCAQPGEGYQAGYDFTVTRAEGGEAPLYAIAYMRDKVGYPHVACA